MRDADDTLTATLRLQSLDDLFETPDVSPMSPDYGLHSGGPALEYLADEIYADSSYSRIVATLELPADELVGIEATEVERAIARWATTKHHHVDQDVAASDWRGSRLLVAGIVGFVVLVALARAVAVLDGDVADTIVQGLDVGAWVVLWFPLDLLIFTRWQHRLDRRAYRIVRDMRIELRPQPERIDDRGRSA